MPRIISGDSGPNCTIRSTRSEGGDRFADAPPPSPMAVPPVMATAAQGEVVLTDTFDNPKNGVLPSTFSGQFVATYEDGEFMVRIVDPQLGIGIVRVPGVFGDATLAVTARLVGEALGRYIIINCRQSDQGYCRLSVDPQAGTFRLSRWDRRGGDATATTLLNRSSSAIHRGTQANRLEMSCIGSTISARINGTTVGSVEDAMPAEGEFRLGAGSYEEASMAVEARLDDLVITRPPPTPLSPPAMLVQPPAPMPTPVPSIVATVQQVVGHGPAK